MSRADLTRETGLTRVTISDLVGDLIEDTYIIELGVRPATGPGKPAIIVDLNTAGHSIIALDISRADVLTGSRMCLDGTVVQHLELPVPSQPVDVFDSVVSIARDLIIESRSPILGVGVGIPGVVDDEGVVLSAPNLGWSNFDLRTQLESELHLPVVAGNDANAAVLAEYTLSGSGEDIMLVKIDRAVGAGLLSAGMPLRGYRSAAGEIGHVTVGYDDGVLCVCGKYGCLETWISVPALSERLAASSDPEQVLRDAGARLGVAIAPIVGALDLSEIVLAGPSDILGGACLDAAAETVQARTMREFHRAIRLRMTKHGREVVTKGAAVRVLAGQRGIS